MIKLKLQELFEWRGRINRKKFLELHLILTLFLLVSSIPIVFILLIKELIKTGPSYLIWAVWVIYLIGVLGAASFSQTVIMIRRFHDLNLTGWVALSSFIPYIGLISWFLLLFVKGSTGENKFGPDPLNPTLNKIHDNTPPLSIR